MLPSRQQGREQSKPVEAGVSPKAFYRAENESGDAESELPAPGLIWDEEREGQLTRGSILSNAHPLTNLNGHPTPVHISQRS